MEEIVGYLDDSFDDVSRGKTAYVIGGYLADDGFWRDTFTPAWARALETAVPMRKAREFKASDCRSCVGEFAGWDNKTEAAVLTKAVVDVIANSSPPTRMLGVACAVAFIAQEDILSSKQIDRRAFSLAFRGALAQVLLYARHYPAARIRLIPDRKASFGGLMTECFEGLLEDADAGIRQRVALMPPQDSIATPPLQAADLLAYEAFREARHRLNPSARPPSRALERLVASHFHLATCIDYIDLLKGLRLALDGMALDDIVATGLTAHPLFRTGVPLRSDDHWPFVLRKAIS